MKKVLKQVILLSNRKVAQVAVKERRQSSLEQTLEANIWVNLAVTDAKFEA